MPAVRLSLNPGEVPSNLAARRAAARLPDETLIHISDSFAERIARAAHSAHKQWPPSDRVTHRACASSECRSLGRGHVGGLNGRDIQDLPACA